MTHTLYRFWSALDDLLYIGITGDPYRRWKDHAARQTWWPEVSRVTVEHYSDREALEEAEETAIRSQRPRHNVAMNQPQRRTPPRQKSISGSGLTPVPCYRCETPMKADHVTGFPEDDPWGPWPRVTVTCSVSTCYAVDHLLLHEVNASPEFSAAAEALGPNQVLRIR